MSNSPRRLHSDAQAIAAAHEVAGQIAELARDPQNRQVMFDLSSALHGAGKVDEAVTLLLDLFKLDRDWNDGAAKARIVAADERDDLVKASVDEIKRLAGSSVSPAQLARWQEQMQQSFVDVQAGTRITGVYLPGQGARFFVGQQLQHEIDDPQFARAFFDIWLDPRTRSPELREQLLGVNP